MALKATSLSGELFDKLLIGLVVFVLYLLAASPVGSMNKLFFKETIRYMHLEFLKILHISSALPTLCFCILHWESLLCSGVVKTLVVL